MATQIKRDLYADVTSRLALSVIKSELREGPYAFQSSEPEALGCSRALIPTMKGHET
jgi:hypothetical protein